MAEIAKTEIADTTANPAPLGLVAFGLTTVLLNLHNAGFYELGSMVLGLGIFYGGLAQVIAGIMEWKKNNTFGTIAFISYGFFWLSFVALVALPKQVAGIAATTRPALVAFLVLWGVFTGALFIGTLRLNRVLQLVFATLTILFFLLAFGEQTENAAITKLAGYEGVVCGLLAMYGGLAQVLNELYGRVVFPLGPVRK